MALVRTRGRKALRWLLLCVTSVLALALLSGTALAREFEVSAVDISATVHPDGSLAVTQQRTYEFEGTFNGIVWDVPRGTYRGREVDATISWVGAITNGEQVLFEEGYEGAPGTYELTDGGDYWGLKMYWPASDESVTFQVSYEVPNLVSRWEDVGELYWQYVLADPGSESEWHNVTLKVELPIPDGTAVTPGENVRAWGHGPIDSTVDFEGDGVRYFSPGVGAAEFLEARVVFPGEWLSSMEPEGESRLEAILEEEDEWAKEANEKRRKARMIVYGVPGFLCLAGIGSIIASFVHKRVALSKVPKAQFNDTYFRDVPTNDHPAVLGMLHRDGRLEVKDFSATLMRLADQGRISLDAVWTERKTKRGGTKREREWRLLSRNTALKPNTDTRAGGKKIDDMAFDFLFNVVGNKHKHVIDPQLLGPEGEPYVLMSFFNEVADNWPQAYASGYDRWSDAVRDAYGKRKFSDVQGDNIFQGALGLGDVALSVIVSVAGMFLGVPNMLLCIGFLACFGAGLFLILTDEDESNLVFSQEAAEIKAKLEALKRWLTDFTRLEEAIPTDVVLWNRLLVMATVLGVADEVVKQLKVFAPELVNNPDFQAYRWCGGEIEDLDKPVVSIGRSVDTGRKTSSSHLYHEVSTHDTATSYDSSSSGSGGGFSSGGGGGYSGGGGRGGAF